MKSNLKILLVISSVSVCVALSPAQSQLVCNKKFRSNPHSTAFMTPTSLLVAPSHSKKKLVLHLRGGSGGEEGGKKESFLEANSSEESDYDEFVSETEESDNEPDVISVHAEVVIDPQASDFPSEFSSGVDASNAAAISQSREIQRGAYSRSALLWAALMLDSVLNKAKRSSLFGDLSLIETISPTAALASGFLVSSSVIYLLSTLITEDSDSLYTDYCKRLNLSLIGFSALNLMTSTAGPFLGKGCSVIMIHNGLTALNGWIKGVRGINGGKSGDFSIGGVLNEILEGTKSTLAGLRMSRSISSMGYLAGIVFVVARLLQVFAALMLRGKAVVPLTAETTRMVVLQWASCARSVMVAGIFSTLKDAADRNQLDEPFFWKLNGAVAVASATAFVGTIAPIFMEGTSNLTLYGKMKLPVSALISALSGFNCVASFLRKRKAA